MMFISLRYGTIGPSAVAAVGFAAGLTLGAIVHPVSSGRGAPVPAPSALPEVEVRPESLQRLSRGHHVATVTRVFDGDTFEARVHVWPGLDITTKVRLRGIDAPELNARCADERTRAEAAQAALSQILADGDVTVGRISLDKYGGRVIADVSTRAQHDVGGALVATGLARRYDGGRRQPWCEGL